MPRIDRKKRPVSDTFGVRLARRAGAALVVALAAALLLAGGGSVAAQDGSGYVASDNCYYVQAGGQWVRQGCYLSDGAATFYITPALQDVGPLLQAGQSVELSIYNTTTGATFRWYFDAATGNLWSDAGAGWQPAGNFLSGGGGGVVDTTLQDADAQAAANYEKFLRDAAFFGASGATDPSCHLYGCYYP